MAYRRGVRYMLAVCLLLVVTTTVACSSGTADTSDTTLAPGTSAVSGTTVPTAGATSTSSPPVTLSPYDLELADTAAVANDLARALGDVQTDDPRVAIVLGLRARVQALYCRKSLETGDIISADTAMRDVYSTINRGRKVAAGSVATTLESAYATIETVGNPSDSPDQAKASLDTFIEQLRPLLDQAQTIISGSTG